MTPKNVLIWTGVGLVLVIALSFGIAIVYSVGVTIIGAC
jgi:hypothetical protein